MKKLLILPLSLLILASCGGKTSGGSNGDSTLAAGWSEDIKSDMTSSLGIVLPYMELSNTRFYVTDDLFQIYAEGNSDDLEAYRQLLETDFNYQKTVNDRHSEPVTILESKNLEKAVRIELEIDQNENDSGDIIDYLNVMAYRYVSWPTQAIEALGVYDVPQYDGDNKLGMYVEIGAGGDLGDYVEIRVFEGSSASYSETLREANFLLGNYGDNGAWDGQYDYLDYAYNPTSDTFIQYYQDGEVGMIMRVFLYDYNPAPEAA